MSNMTATQHLEIIREKNRPTVNDYIPAIFNHFTELHGDRHQGRVAALGADWEKLAQEKAAFEARSNALASDAAALASRTAAVATHCRSFTSICFASRA